MSDQKSEIVVDLLQKLKLKFKFYMLLPYRKNKPKINKKY